MTIIPYEKYFLKTQLKLEELKGRLRENIEEGNYFKRHFTGDKAYEGEIVKDYFQIQMITPGQNPFKAIVRGKFFEKSDETIIGIKLSIQPQAIILIVVITIMFIFSMFFAIRDLIHHIYKSDNEIAAVVFLIVYFAIIGLYNLHVQYIKDNLKIIFIAEEFKQPIKYV